MKTYRILIAALVLCVHTPVFAAKPIIADLAVRSITIDHNFSGIEILLFGARLDVGEIVAVIRGPEQSYVVRKKARVAGVWTNTESIVFDHVPSFYAIASSRLLSRIKNDHLLKELGIGIKEIQLVSDDREEGKNLPEFRDAFIRKKLESGLYGRDIQEVMFWGETLFRVPVTFPKTIPRGIYSVEVYLFQDGQLTAMQVTPLSVSSAGIEAFLYDAAHHHALLYGISCVAMALAAGWIASIAFRKV